MNAEIKAAIESDLLAIGTWVPAKDICEKFKVTERQLRQIGDEEGLCSGFAISRTHSGGGFKHVTLATTKEWLEFKHQRRKHGISELVNVRALDKRRHNAIKTVRNFSFERDSGQGLLLQVGGVA